MNDHVMNSIYSLTQDEIRQFLVAHDQSTYLAPLIFELLYKKNKKQQISDKTLSLLKTHFDFNLPKIVKTHKSLDGTYKFLMQFSDGMSVETVLIPFHKKYTICLSSQVGCAMKCSFCFTGTQGLKRHLKSSEIIGQYILAKEFLLKEVSDSAFSPNIVLMGQGEPLHNFDEVQKALTILLDDEGLALGPRQITLSTAGYLPGLKKFNQLPKINLALSLHSPFNNIRKSLIPIASQYALEDLFAALDEIKLMKRQYITYEYLLIDGLNDREEDAEALAKLLRPRKAIINIIPFNPYPGSQYKRPAIEKIEFFKNKLVEKKLRTMVRSTKGEDILAACGQLVSEELQEAIQ
jgi:23S rRNA (adenine2503-C2)-methyltransferase